jgi:hypothetical protein
LYGHPSGSGKPTKEMMARGTEDCHLSLPGKKGKLQSGISLKKPREVSICFT